MNRLNRAAVALAVCGGLLVATPLFANQTKKTPPKPAAPAAQPATPAQPSNAPAKFVPILRGDADIQVLQPVPKRDGKMIVTTITVKNMSQQAIAGLKVEENWWDKSNMPVGGDVKRAPKPIQPGETYTFTLQDEADTRMFRPTYQFSHANGKVRTKSVKKF